VLQAARVCPRGQVVPARRPGPAGEPMAVVRTLDGRVFAVPDSCPHDGGPLSDGYLDGDRLVCARHGWEFDPASGRCLGRRGVCIPSEPVERRENPRAPRLL
jgi:nitrite reductase/ring-hydroxylating ferredoxin subunit